MIPRSVSRTDSSRSRIGRGLAYASQRGGCRGARLRSARRLTLRPATDDPPRISFSRRSRSAPLSRRDGGEAWRRIYELPGTAADLLAGSERLLAAVGADGSPVLRWYVTPQPALVLGVGQPRDDFDAAACRRAGLPIVRRSSGGTAVLADDGLLNLDVALPAAHPLGHRDVVRAYAWLGSALTRALGRLGWAACAIAPDAARRDTTDAPCRRAPRRDPAPPHLLRRPVAP